ncbi:MAG: SLC13 family permease [Gemmatimonadaceae bacterium]|nr:SLC13 family permease [Gemmatimonadaceae bacterium]
MSPAVASLIALLVAIVVSMVARLNVGLLAIVLAWGVGVGLGGMKVDAVLTGFPGSLFVTLVGVTALFAVAETNGTLARVAQRAVRLVRGDARWLPLIFCALAMVLSTIGPGAIATVALLAPVAMAIGVRAGVRPLVMALLVGNGANAGNLSPVSTVGVIANAKMAEAGLVDHAGVVWFANAAAHLLVAIGAYALFGGWRTQASADITAAAAASDSDPLLKDSDPLLKDSDPLLASLTREQGITLAVIAAWLVAVVAFTLPPGPSALTAALVLLVARSADETRVLRALPWGVLLMVCGVSVLVAVLEKTGGMALFTALLASIATAGCRRRRSAGHRAQHQRGRRAGRCLAALHARRLVRGHHRRSGRGAAPLSAVAPLGARYVRGGCRALPALRRPARALVTVHATHRPQRPGLRGSPRRR